MLSSFTSGLCLLCIATSLRAQQPVEELKLAETSTPGVSREGWRLRAEPREGHYLRLSVQDFGNRETHPGPDKPLHETTRIIWTSGKKWTGDIICDYQAPAVPADVSAKTTATVRAFGSAIPVGPMELHSSGYTGTSLEEPASGKGAWYIYHHLHFKHRTAAPAEWRTLAFVVQSIDEAEARRLADASGITLPEAGAKRWTIDLPPTPEQTSSTKP